MKYKVGDWLTLENIKNYYVQVTGITTKINVISNRLSDIYTLKHLDGTEDWHFVSVIESSYKLCPYHNTPLWKALNEN